MTGEEEAEEKTGRMECRPVTAEQLRQTREEAWADYFIRHPEVVASWAHQNGYWPYGYRKRNSEEEVCGDAGDSPVAG